MAMMTQGRGRQAGGLPQGGMNGDWLRNIASQFAQRRDAAGGDGFGGGGVGQNAMQGLFGGAAGAGAIPGAAGPAQFAQRMPPQIAGGVQAALGGAAGPQLPQPTQRAGMQGLSLARPDVVPGGQQMQRVAAAAPPNAAVAQQYAPGWTQRLAGSFASQGAGNAAAQAQLAQQPRAEPAILRTQPNPASAGLAASRGAQAYAQAEANRLRDEEA